jgi:hypothetical protein
MPETLMRFALCSHCGHRDRLADDAEGVHMMCNGCGHFNSMRFIGVTDPAVADQLRAEFPEPSVDEIGVPRRR